VTLCNNTAGALHVEIVLFSAQNSETQLCETLTSCLQIVHNKLPHSVYLYLAWSISSQITRHVAWVPNVTDIFISLMTMSVSMTLGKLLTHMCLCYQAV